MSLVQCCYKLKNRHYEPTVIPSVHSILITAPPVERFAVLQYIHNKALPCFLVCTGTR